MKDSTDEDIVKLALEDISAFGTLVERYETRLKYYISRISHFSELETEDILQEVFIKAWKNLNKFDFAFKWSTWIYQITRNEVISQYRKVKNNPHDLYLTDDEEVLNKISDKFDFTEELNHKFQAEEVRTILESLSLGYREVLILKYLEDKSYEEIVDIIQKPMGTVGTLINRAKKQFKTAYIRKFKQNESS